MERFLEHLGDAPVLLIAPPPMTAGTWVTEARLLPDSRQLAAGYRDLAERLGIRFAAAAGWGIETLFDGVHFSEAGHRVFAEKIRRELEAF